MVVGVEVDVLILRVSQPRETHVEKTKDTVLRHLVLDVLRQVAPVGQRQRANKALAARDPAPHCSRPRWGRRRGRRRGRGRLVGGERRAETTTHTLPAADLSLGPAAAAEDVRALQDVPGRPLGDGKAARAARGETSATRHWWIHSLLRVVFLLPSSLPLLVHTGLRTLSLKAEPRENATVAPVLFSFISFALVGVYVVVVVVVVVVVQIALVAFGLL